MSKPAARPLIPPRFIRFALVSVAFSATLVTAMAIWYSGGTDQGPVDRTLDVVAWSTLRFSLFNESTPYFVKLGDPVPLLAVVLITSMLAWAVRGIRGALLVSISTASTVALVKLILKPLVDRHYGEALSYPSTHVTAIATVALSWTILIAGAPRLRLPVVRLLAAIFPMMIAATSTLAIVAERTHYTTDAVGAWCMAACGVAVTALMLDRPCRSASDGVTPVPR